ncbi:hypothetical protein HRbin23_00739 [bacterium HR23]|nr:hypothetical protein HRbin23_00739 [bacterium HR23]
MALRHKGTGTTTSPFRSPGRFGHDSTRCYASRLYQGLPGERSVSYRIMAAQGTLSGPTISGP